jgi:pimeloyl-ACP methyl ester carboxylesterase
MGRPKRVVAGATLAAVVGALGAATYRTYREDCRRARERLADTDTRVVDTTFGTVEYAETGEGPPVLVSHGICGGADQALATGQALLGGDYRVLGVSRFGYLGSECPADPTPERQADAYRALLDELGIDRAVVLGVSAGGPSVLQFAQRHPERTRALVLVSAALPSEPGGWLPSGPPAATLWNPLFWLFAFRFRGAMLRAFGIDPDAYRAAPPREREAVAATLDTLLPMDPRREGAIVDTEVTNRDVVKNAEAYDLEGIGVPTLLIHAEDDPMADFADARRASERIPDAELAAFPDGGHLVFGHADGVRSTLSRFLSERAAVRE